MGNLDPDSMLAQDVTLQVQIGILITNVSNLTTRLSEYIEEDRTCKQDFEARLRELERARSYSAGVVAVLIAIASFVGALVSAVAGQLIGRP
jgi:hypothetical protein